MAAITRASVFAQLVSDGRALPVDSAESDRLEGSIGVAATDALIEVGALPPGGSPDGSLARPWRACVCRLADGAPGAAGAAGGWLDGPRVALPRMAATLRLECRGGSRRGGTRRVAVIEVAAGGDRGAAGLCVVGVATSADPTALAPRVDVILGRQARVLLCRGAT
jgi:hypothetical protein